MLQPTDTVVTINLYATDTIIIIIPYILMSRKKKYLIH